MVPSGQIPFVLPLKPAYGRDSFIVSACNRDARTFVGRWPDWPSAIAVLSGPAGSGKTHLAHIWRAESGATFLGAADLGESALRTGTGALRRVVDDISVDSLPERDLFHLINRVRESGGALLLAAREPASRWPITLPDLKSRLRLATPVEIAMPDDDLLRQVLVKLFADRQLVVDRLVIDYLLVRMPRSFDAARQLVERLDVLALAEGRRITRHLAARAFDAAQADDDGTELL